MIEITVNGLPAPQGSKRHVGHGVMIESSAKVKPWREAVKWAARETLQGAAGLAGPVVLEITFTLPKPKSAPKRRKTWPDRKPDVSKLLRSTEDALTEMQVFEDDARVVECVVRKVFPGEHKDALGIPGAVIRVWAIEEKQQEGLFAA